MQWLLVSEIEFVEFEILKPKKHRRQRKEVGPENNVVAVVAAVAVAVAVAVVAAVTRTENTRGIERGRRNFPCLLVFLGFPSRQPHWQTTMITEDVST